MAEKQDDGCMRRQQQQQQLEKQRRLCREDGAGVVEGGTRELMHTCMSV